MAKGARVTKFPVNLKVDSEDKDTQHYGEVLQDISVEYTAYCAGLGDEDTAMGLSEFGTRFITHELLLPWSEPRSAKRLAHARAEKERHDKERVLGLGASPEAIRAALKELQDPDPTIEPKK